MTQQKMSEDNTGNGPLSWRDVYQAVKDSEGRITALIQTSVGPLSKASEDHERRIRIIEERGPNISVQNAQEIAKLEGRVDLIEDGFKGFRAREEGVFGTVRVLRIVIATALTTAIAFGGIISALSALGIIPN